MNLTEFRKKYSQYDDMTDAQLAGRLHAKYYPGVPIAEYNRAIGITEDPKA